MNEAGYCVICTVGPLFSVVHSSGDRYISAHILAAGCVGKINKEQFNHLLFCVELWRNCVLQAWTFVS